MHKELIDKISEDIDNNSNKTEASKTEASKRLCVHELTRKLKEKEKKENIGKLVILSILIFFIGFLLLLIY